MDEEVNELELLLEACAAEAEAVGEVGWESVVDVSDAVTGAPNVAAVELLRPALEHMLRVAASDLHLKVGSRPQVRVGGHLHPAPLPVLSDDDCADIVASTMDVGLRERFEWTNEADYAFAVEGIGRFRLNAFRERGRCALAVRRVPTVVPNAQTLGLLPAVQRLAVQTGGLCLFAGRVGSGKSTTLAWIVDRINDTRDANVITIEDPIEYLHTDKRSIIHQREVGKDTDSYAEALRRALRQDPDVIVIGEIRDEDTARGALGAALAGHLVLATLHTDTAGETIDRLIELFSPEHRAQARLSLAATLHAVICQRLVSRSSDRHQVLAQEVLLATGRIAQRIVDPTGKGPSIADMIADDEHLGMVSFDQHLLTLYQAGTLPHSDALRAATNPHDLSLQIDRT